jgi:hypothetical protein
VVSYLQASQPKPYKHLSPLPCVPHVQPTSSSLKNYILWFDIIICPVNLILLFIDSSVGIVTRLPAGRAEFDSRQGMRIFLLCIVPSPALDPTQPHIQWAPEFLSPGLMRPGHEADHSSLSRSEVKNAWCCTSTPSTSSWHDA